MTFNTGGRRSLAFLDDGVVEEAPGGVFHRQPVPQGEVIDGEQVVFVRRSQEVPARSKVKGQRWDKPGLIWINEERLTLPLWSPPLHI